MEAVFRSDCNKALPTLGLELSGREFLCSTFQWISVSLATLPGCLRDPTF